MNMMAIDFIYDIALNRTQWRENKHTVDMKKLWKEACYH